MYDPTKPYKDEILKLIRKTWKTPFVEIKDDTVYKKFSDKYKEFFHTDGIGTKGIYHWKKRSFKNAVLDALAMNLNDLLLKRAIPYALLSHIMIPKDDKKAILEIVKNTVKECKKRKISIAGGETSIHNNIKGMELSFTILGFVKKKVINKFKNKDILIGIKSNGIHSNGFTKVREIFKKFKKDFIKPTYIYWDKIIKLDEKYNINCIAHITGGGFTKLKNFLPKNLDIIINKNHNLKPQKIFQDIYKKGVTDSEMYKTFNCGIGLILSINGSQAKDLLKDIKSFKADIIGKVKKGKGNIIIHSQFSEKKILF